MTDFIITADQHINLRDNTNFEKARHIQFFELLAKENAKNYVLSGDIFERAKPTLEELELFYKCVSILPNKVWVTDGNHEGIDRILSTFSFLPEVGYSYVADGVIYSDKFHDIYLVGHRNIKYIVEKVHTLKNKNNILLTHIRCTTGLFKEEIKLRPIADIFDHIIMGDIHYKHSPFPNMHYTTQPFNDKYTPEVDNGYYKITLEGKLYKEEYIRVSLPNKIKLSVKSINYKALLATLDKGNIYKIFVTGTADELTDLPNPPKNVEVAVDLIADDIVAVLDDIKLTGVVDFETVLLNLTISAFDLPEEYEEIGELIIKEAISD